MKVKTENMFGNAAKKREQELKTLTDTVTGNTHQEKRVTMTVSMSESEKRMLKQYAAAHSKTAASLIQEWIRRFCAE